MAPRSIYRIAALAASILICMALALGACMAKRAEVKEAPSGVTASDGNNQPSPVSSPDRTEKAQADAGITTAGPKPAPRKPAPRTPIREKPVVSPRGNSGMVGQMHLEGGE